MEVFGLDAYTPREIAGRVNDFAVAKARLPLLTLWMLGMLAGAFIGLGALYYTLVVSDASLGFAAARVAGGVCFSLGLLLVVVAGYLRGARRATAQTDSALRDIPGAESFSQGETRQ